MLDILNTIPGKKRLSQNGWYNFNAVCCHHRGHNPDKKFRGGILLSDEFNWSYHCFNCGFTCGFSLSKNLSFKARQLLTWCGLSQEDISKISLENIKSRSVYEYLETKKKISKPVSFEEAQLPDNTILIDPKNKEHVKFVEYLKSRGFSHDEYPFMITPGEEGRNSDRIVIPYTFENKIVGYINHYIDGRFPKYIKSQQTGYVFGIDLQKPEWQVCIVAEGIFDALSVSGCALTHDGITPDQAMFLKRLNKTIIVVPDQDKTGLKICEQALSEGFQVSIPDWHPGIKDINDAVIKYGRLSTVLSILKSATNNKIKVEMKRRRIDKRL